MLRGNNGVLWTGNKTEEKSVVAYFKILVRNSPKTEKNYRKAQLGYPMSGSRDSKQVPPAYALPLELAWCHIARPRVSQ